MLLLATIMALRALRRLAPEARTVVAVALAVALLFLMGRYALDNGAFHLHEAERKYPAVGDAVLTRVGQGGWVLAAQHSGSLRLYAGSRTVRWDLVQPRDIDRVIELLGARGRPPLLVLDPGEVDLFRERFSGSRALTAMALVSVVQELSLIHI